MAKIKLLKIGKLEDGTIRLQSQLYVGRDSADFIIENDVLKCYGHGSNGFGFYPYNKPFEIVESKKDMITQQL